MKKVLFALLLSIAIGTTSCLEKVAKPDQQSHVATVAHTPPSDAQQQIYALQWASVHDMVDAQSRRIDDIQYQQTWFMAFLAIGVALLAALITYMMNNKLRSLRKDFEDQQGLIKEKMDLLDDTVSLARERVKLFNKDIESVIKLAKDKVQKEAETANIQISAQLGLQLEDAKRALNEIVTHRDNVAELVREIQASQGDLTPEQVERVEQQVKETQKTKTEDEYTASDWYLEGQKARENKEYESAIEFYQKAIALDPNNDVAFHNWGYSLTCLEKHEEAIEKYKQRIAISPNSPASYSNWGYCLIQLKKHEEAIDILSKCLTLNPKHAKALKHWGTALIGLEKFEESLPKFAEAIKLEPTYIDAYTGWNDALNLLLETNPTLYPYKVNEFKEVIARNKDLEQLRNHEEFKYIYKKYFS